MAALMDRSSMRHQKQKWRLDLPDANAHNRGQMRTVANDIPIWAWNVMRVVVYPWQGYSTLPKAVSTGIDAFAAGVLNGLIRIWRQF